MNIKFPCYNVDDDLDCLWGILSISIKVMEGIDPEPVDTKSLSEKDYHQVHQSLKDLRKWSSTYVEDP